MEVIPVLDVWRGQAVHARGGDRRAYKPVASVLADGSDPVVLARAFRDRLGARSCYLADLDALASAPPSFGLVRALAREGLRLWVDAAIRDADRAREVLTAGAHRAVVALETLPHPDALAPIAAAVHPDSLAFSLDLRQGQPIAASHSLATLPPLELAAGAYRAGYRTLILLDLARVGRVTGPADDLASALRARLPDLSLVVGGGVRNREDLRRLAELGCTAAAVATALHTGHITREDLEAL